MFKFATFPAWAFEIIFAAVMALMFFALGWHFGADHVQDQWDADIARQNKAAAKTEKAAVAVSEIVTTKFIDRVQVIHEKARTIIKEVTVYVTKKDDSNCSINSGFVQLFNQSPALDTAIPDASSSTYGLPSGVALSDVASAIAENHEAFDANAEQLKALQEWVREQLKVFNG